MATQTIKQRLASNKDKRDSDFEKNKARNKRVADREKKELAEAVKVIRKALTGFRPKPYSGIYGEGFSIKFGGSGHMKTTIYVACQHNTREVRYSDDTQPVLVRSLSVSYGRTINVPAGVCSVDGFTDTFTCYLERERLV